jgi:heptosyltransferase-2
VTQSTAGSAVIQVKPGIGDVVWHLPFIRAIAAVSPGGCVAFLAPPTSGAKELLVAEPCIAETIYFEHSGSELRRGVNLIRLAALLRRRRFHTVWILDRTLRPAVAAMLAGIPERIGLGLGAQRFFITNAGVDYSHFHDHPIGWLRALMAAMNVPLPTTEPDLHVPAEVLAAIGARYGSCARPWIVLGIGASDPQRDWPDASWSEFLAGLRQKTSGTVFLIGGSGNITRATKLIERGDGAAAVNACALPLGEALALLRRADLFVGTDSGPMNLALAAGTPAFALFGVNPVLNYSRFIHPIAPQGGPAPGGMLQISPLSVLAQVTPYLASRKEPA